MNHIYLEKSRQVYKETIMDGSLYITRLSSNTNLGIKEKSYN